MTVAAVWNIADIFNGLMAIPNLIALLWLSGVVARETREYFRRYPKFSDAKRAMESGGPPEEEGGAAEGAPQADGRNAASLPPHSRGG